MNSPRACSLLVLGGGLAALSSGGCDGGVVFLDAGQTSPVFIVGVEGLNLPPVAESGLYLADEPFAIDPSDPAAGNAVGFFAHVAAASGAGVRMRMLPGPGIAPIEFESIAPPGIAAGAAPPWQLDEPGRSILRSGRGVYWVAASDEIDQQLGVVLPDRWSGPSIGIEVYSQTTASGDPLSGDRVELARDVYYLVAIGDSIVWGNGLRDQDKFSALIAQEIQRRTGRRVIRRVHAISGSRIMPRAGDIICRVSCNGEVQTANTPILSQVELIEAPDRVDLLLMDGCINDVGLGAILSPDTDDTALADATVRACHEDMLTLLRKVRAAAPRAGIVVTGYYPIVSLESTLPELVQLFLARGDETAGGAPDLVVSAADQSSVFVATAHGALRGAIEEFKLEAPAASVLFADPEFNEKNAMFASQALLWGLTSERIQTEAADEGLTLYPEDPMANLRAAGCFRNALVDPLGCVYASVGHPNVAGTRRYADSVLSVLEAHALIPPAP